MRHIPVQLLVPLLLASAAFADPHAPAAAPQGPSADQAYRMLVEGHSRYAANTRVMPHQDELRRCETTTGGQHPIAAVLSCADSRVPPEMLFDQGIGDLFVIRVAGNVAATDELGTLEYGVEHLNIPLIVVLGHSRCGAVTAVVDGAHAEGNLAQLLKPIVPAAERAKHDHPGLRGAPLVSAAIQENVRQATNDLVTRSPVIAKAVAAKRVQIVGGVYDIHAGRIDWLDSSTLAAVTASPSVAPAADEHPAAASVPSHHPQPTETAHAPQPTHAVEHAAPVEAHPAEPKAAHAAVEPHASADHSTLPTPTNHAKAPVTAVATHAPAAESKALPALAPKAVTTTLADHWPVLGGAVLTSTLIGAGITHFATRPKI